MKTPLLGNGPASPRLTCWGKPAAETLRTGLLITVAATGLAVGAGCSAGSSSRSDSAGGTVPVSVVAQPSAVGVPATAPDAPPSAVAAVVPQPGEVPAPVAPPQLSPSAEEVVHLARARVGEDVMAAYIEGVEAPFGLDSDAILYLTDLGVPAETIATMVRRDQALKSSTQPAAASLAETAESAANATPAEPGPAGQTPINTAVVAPPASTVPMAEAEAAAVAEGTTQITNNYFYDTLSPYGTWVEMPDYGWCWQPSVAVAQPDWRPYRDGGRWMWTDCGWYWQSYYSWGWAPFHYGRWQLSSDCGWLWVPGTTWGPAWVTWRYYDGYCGWAPLPPAAVYTTGIGFTYYGGYVGFGFGFGLSSYCYSFIPTTYFCTSRPWTYCVPPSTVNTFYGNTTVINNYVNGDNNTIINRGIGTDAIAAATRSELPAVRVADVADVGTRGAVRAERLSRDGTTLAAYRPQLPQQATRPPAAVTQRQEQAAVRSASVVESRAVEAARLRVSPSGERARLSATDSALASSTAMNARPSSSPARAAEAAAGRVSAQYSTVDRTLPVRTQDEAVRANRAEPPRSTTSPALQRSAPNQSVASPRAVPSSQRADPSSARTPSQPAAPRSSVAPQATSRTFTPSRAEPRRSSPSAVTPAPRSATQPSPTTANPTAPSPAPSARNFVTPNLPSRPAVQIPQGTVRSAPAAPRSAPSTFSPRSAPSSPAYTPRSAPAPRSTYSPPASMRSTPAPAPSRSAPSSSFRSPAPSPSSAPAPRAAPSSPGQTGSRTVPNR